ncbi:rRNA pseudouridine synthase [Virgibacillus halodenitrificans]|uniref:pseudouridine synthase n=1 Tax=Virgibacillus halodenitrificans TaxID=1482 RepID=UPI001F1882CA|nr:pseudouridine synthase [Virgibacillus halodenitrificans]MCG1027742.1 rRNA pseudouridine synthase [Virgibacillus halodenitrificans]
MRLDKLLSNSGVGTRKEVKALLKKKHVKVNELIIKDGSKHIDPEKDIIKVNEEIVYYQKYIYLMLHKPSGCISATVDKQEKTVIDLLDKELQHYKPFPVGRLDKDTEGLLLLTNDGELAHQLTSPKKDIEKVYYAKIKGRVTAEDVKAFEEGIILDDGYQAKSAQLRIMAQDEISEIEVTVTEGKFHQVKRMFEAVDKKVIYLKRIRMGNIILDDTLKRGTWRELSESEKEYCLSLKSGG